MKGNRVIRVGLHHPFVRLNGASCKVGVLGLLPAFGHKVGDLVAKWAFWL